MVKLQLPKHMAAMNKMYLGHNEHDGLGAVVVEEQFHNKTAVRSKLGIDPLLAASILVYLDMLDMVLFRLRHSCYTRQELLINYFQ